MQSHGIASPCPVTGTPSFCCLKQEQTFPCLLASGAALMPRLGRETGFPLYVQKSPTTALMLAGKPLQFREPTTFSLTTPLRSLLGQTPPWADPSYTEASVGSDRWPGCDTKGQREAPRLCPQVQEMGEDYFCDLTITTDILWPEGKSG